MVKLTKIFVILLLFSIYSCVGNQIGYNHKWVLEVTYTDGSKDTLSSGYVSDIARGCIYLKISSGGLLSGGGTSPCVVMGCGYQTIPVACDVRRYDVLSHEVKILN